MITSFRLRLALSSALLTGLALAAFGFSTWWLIRGVKIERLDDALRIHAEREAGRSAPEFDGSKIEADISGSLGLRKPGDLSLLIQDGAGETIYQSANWPAHLDAGQLPWPRRLERRAANVASGWLISSALAAEDSGNGWRDAQANPPPDFRPEGQAGERPPRRPGERWRPPRLRPPPRDMERPPLQDRPGQRAQGTAATTASGADAGIADQPISPLQPQLQPEPAPRPLPPVSTVTGASASGQAWRLGLASGGAARVAVAVNLHTLDEEMQSVRTAYLIAFPIALFLIGLGAWIFSSRALKPIEKLTAATRRVTAEGLDQRISAAGEDKEFVELIEVYNSMLARLRRSFQQAYRFSADAAHELKTPLAILQGQLERAINNAEDGSPMQVELTSILDEVRRLSTISRKLLLLSQADAGRLSANREPFRLSEALANLVEDTQMLAPHLQVSGDIQPDIVISADGGLLQQVLHNLVSNAIKYNVDRGKIHISAKALPQVVEVVIANTSRGIPASERDRIFERFFRADPSRNRQVEGLGLGLALSREIARAHRGDLSFKVGDDDTVKFSLVLPR